ncbi:MAG: tetratricopeptide repeat protein, partial [Croceibacterium sp.]
RLNLDAGTYYVSAQRTDASGSQTINGLTDVIVRGNYQLKPDVAVFTFAMSLPTGQKTLDASQRQVASAWVLNAEGRKDEALKAMSVVADAEDKTDKSPVTPGPLAPARELLGEMLLENGKAQEALAAFEATKAKEPNRFNGYYGAARASEKLGDKVKARENYEKLVALAETSSRPEVAAARKYLASN